MTHLSDKDIGRRLDLAVELARQCGARALELRRDRAALDVQAKGQRDFVTVADVAVERMIRERLAHAFPGDGFLGEEGGGGAAPLLWVVDPIDGTTNYSHGLPGFAVSIAFCVDGKPAIGVIAEPAAGAMYTTRRGAGAFRDRERLKVSATRGLDRCLVDFGYTEKRGTAANLDMQRKLLDAGCDLRQNGSAALGLARVAAGEFDGYCELHINSWDVLAGLLMVEEAGGRSSDFLANDGMLRGNPMLAATPGVADELAAVLGIALR
ncbi:MAG: inositol monophosphatase [Alphaproteobacteria bacterium]|nr:inositol monophosphatase [Alphaproteobacteria bacterium]